MAVLVAFAFGGCDSSVGTKQSSAPTRAKATTTASRPASSPASRSASSSPVTASNALPAQAALPAPSSSTTTEGSTTTITAPTPPVAAGGSIPRPNPQLTPGATDARVTDANIAQTICVRGYTSTVRNVSVATKNRVYAAYGIRSHRSGEYEIDHLIPLEIGGSNDASNLWPEPEDGSAGARSKDSLEGVMHRAVCSGRVELGEAQRAMASDWYALDQFMSLSGSSATNAPAVTAPSTTAANAAPTLGSADVTGAAPCAPGQIKANRNSGIYHVPGGAYYARTSANVACFDTEAEAQAGGYRRSKD